MTKSLADQEVNTDPPAPDIPVITVKTALRQWRMAPEATIDCGGFNATLRFFGASNQLVQAELAKRQNASALLADDVGSISALSDEEFMQDVESWCRIALVKWDMMSDPVMKGRKVIQEPMLVPLAMAPSIFCEHGIGGKELYYAMFMASRDRKHFLITEQDVAKTEKN